MKKLIALLAVCVFSFALAADPALVAESAAPFDGAIKGISDTVTLAHLPGYGLNVNARYWGDFDPTQVIEQLRSIVVGLSALIHGLDDGDFVSVAWTGNPFMGQRRYLVVRMIPGDPTSLEVYLDGVKQ